MYSENFWKKILDSSSKDNLFFSFAPHAFGKEGPPEKILIQTYGVTVTTHVNQFCFYVFHKNFL